MSTEKPTTPEDNGRSRDDGAPEDDAGAALELEAENAASEPEAAAEFPVVAVGASAGGLEAIGALLKRIQCDGMGVVIVQHLAQGQEVFLTDLLGKMVSVPVATIKEGTVLEKNRIYVAPPNAGLTLEKGVFHLAPTPERTKLAIDHFFRSLAADQGTAAIAVILSGAGADGALGLQAIKDSGGITFVQDPETASQPSMPQHALDTGFADFCMSPEEIGDELMRLSAHPYVARPRKGRRVLGPERLRGIFGALREAFGIDFSSYKPASVERRIERRMALHRLETLEEYLKYIAANATELSLLYHDLLIGVTSFFRDKEPFEALKSIVFPRLLERREPEIPIRIWVPGCSTGEEAYSIAIAVLEYLGDRAPDLRLQIFATDVDEQSLERARIGIYPLNIEVDVSPGRLQRFFSRTDKGYQVSRQLREMIVFARHNLAKDPPFSRLDLVSCRNVLIYFQAQVQKRVARVFHYSLNPGGYVLCGNSESMPESADLFTLADRKLKLYTKRNTPARASFDIAFGAAAVDHDGDRTRRRPDPRTGLSVAQLADRKVIEKYGPPGVAVNESLEILQFRGRTGPYLEPAPGVATLNLLKLARPELLHDLRTNIKKAFAEALPLSSAPIRMKDEHGYRMVRLDFLPLLDAAASSPTRSLLVIFNEIEAPPQPAPRPEGAAPVDPHVLDLERELTMTKEYLQTTIEELETTNEELMSANEELQSSNEELQSTNEELSTSKEELQSTNEELSTVNEELHHRLTELSVSNDDFQNIMGTANTLIVLVGRDLRIRRFSRAAERVLGLIPADVGRPIGYLSAIMKVGDFEHVVADAMSSISLKELEVRCVDGHDYSLRVFPYKTADQAIRGAVLEFARRIGDPSKPWGHGDWAELLLETLGHPVFALDRDLRFSWSSRAFADAFGVGPDLERRTLKEVWPTVPRELLHRLEEAAADRAQLRQVRVEGSFGRKRAMVWTSSFAAVSGERPAMLAVHLEDVPGSATAP